jgi:nucleoside-diphosphate-sugar epimerase
MNARIARYHDIYGPHGSHVGGREKAPAARCRIAGVSPSRIYRPQAAIGVRGRSANIERVKKLLGWSPQIGLGQGRERSYRWVERQILQ